MTFRITGTDAKNGQQVITLDAVDKDAAFAAAKETGIEPTEIKEIKEIIVAKLALSKPALKRYRVVCDIDASAVAMQSLLWCLLGIATLGLALPFFGYFFCKNILNHIEVVEVEETRQRLVR